MSGTCVGAAFDDAFPPHRHDTASARTRLCAAMHALMACALGGAASFVLPRGLSAADARPDAPNVIVILADDLGYADTGAYGCTDIPTPHIDSIANNGIRFSRGYVTCPVCSPSRAGLLTGRYQARCGAESLTALNETGLDPTARLLPELLHQRGYVSACIGKWHLSPNKGDPGKSHPMDRGFDEFVGFLGGQSNYFVPQLSRGRDATAQNEYTTTTFGREAADFLRRNASNRFFLYLAFNAPHTPLQAPADRLDRFSHLKGKRAVYAAMVSAMDDAVGVVLQSLHDANLDRSTLVFFLSDNGGGPEAGNSSSNGPLRGGKRNLSEGGIRVPFLAQWKGRLSAGQVIDHPVISLDIAATVIALAGAQAAPGQPLDGINLIADGKITAPPSRDLCWRYGPDVKVTKHSQTIIDGPWKCLLIDGGNPQLFDLSSDVQERNDVAGKWPDRVRWMTQKLSAFNAQMPPLGKDAAPDRTTSTNDE